MYEKRDPPKGFDEPTSLPLDDAQADSWQDENRRWWEAQPMRYDWRDTIPFETFSRGYYAEIDRRFFAGAREYLGERKRPFDALIDFQALAEADVLEIGVGHGSHAQLLARHARSYTGIDLTEFAVDSTSRRLELFQVEGRIVRMDAEAMDFADDSFDFIWSWGVIHHSADTGQILKEMRRVLRPGGTAVVMVYYRSFWNYYVLNGFFRGLLQGDLFRTGSLSMTVQRHTDGALARYYSTADWRQLASRYLFVDDIRIYGQKSNLLPLPGGPLKRGLIRLIPNSLSRFLTHQCRMGDFLVSTLTKSD